jgi:hypothetical protein
MIGKRLILSTLSALALTGCGATASLSRILFTGASFADVEVRGVARGCVPIGGALLGAASSIDPRLGAVGALTPLLRADPLGCMLQVEAPEQPGRFYYVFCDARMEATCQGLPIISPVVVTGRPLGPGGILIPSRVVRDE